MQTAKFSMHRDLAGFVFEGSPADRKLILTLAELTFTDSAYNDVFSGGEQAHQSLAGHGA